MIISIADEWAKYPGQPKEVQMAAFAANEELLNYELARVNRVINDPAHAEAVGPKNDGVYVQDAALSWLASLLEIVEENKNKKNEREAQDLYVDRISIKSDIFSPPGSILGDSSEKYNKFSIYSLGKPLNESYWLNKFNRYKLSEFSEPHVGGLSYVFFVKPDLNLNDIAIRTLNIDPGLPNTFMNDIKNLLMTTPSEPHNGLNPTPGFIPLLTNLSENFEVQDYSIRNIESYQTFRGFKLNIPGSGMDSVAGGTFSINYTELDSLPVTYLHKIWLDYIDCIRIGKYSSDKFKARSRHRNRKIADYYSSVFYITVAPDGETIQYFCKLTGVFPLNIPYSAFNWNEGERKITKLNINYAYSYKEDMNIVTLENDFKRIYSSGYESAKNLANTWMEYPYIVLVGNKRKLKFSRI